MKSIAIITLLLTATNQITKVVAPPPMPRDTTTEHQGAAAAAPPPNQDLLRELQSRTAQRRSRTVDSTFTERTQRQNAGAQSASLTAEEQQNLDRAIALSLQESTGGSKPAVRRITRKEDSKNFAGKEKTAIFTNEYDENAELHQALLQSAVEDHARHRERFHQRQQEQPKPKETKETKEKPKDNRRVQFANPHNPQQSRSSATAQQRSRTADAALVSMTVQEQQDLDHATALSLSADGGKRYCRNRY